MYVITVYYHVHALPAAVVEQEIRSLGWCATCARYPAHRPDVGVSAAAGRKVSPLRGDGVDVAEAAEQFLSTNRIGNPNTHRAYASAIGHRPDRRASGCGSAVG